MITVAPSTAFKAVVQFASGLAGTVGVRVTDDAGTTTIARVTAGITEYPAGSGIYQVSITSPAAQGQYSVVWDNGSGVWETEELVVGYSATIGATSPTYITSTQLKATLTLSNTTFADADITAAIAAACRAIDNICQRRFYLDADATSVRYYSPASQTLLEIEDLVTLTSLKSADDGTTTFANVWTLNTDFVLEPLDAAADAQNLWPYTHLRAHPNGTFRFNTFYPRSVEVTAQFGWAAVPSAIVNATTLLANLLLTVSRSAPLGIVPFEGGAIRVARGNPQVMMLISPYMKRRSAVA